MLLFKLFMLFQFLNFENLFAKAVQEKNVNTWVSKLLTCEFVLEYLKSIIQLLDSFLMSRISSSLQEKNPGTLTSVTFAHEQTSLFSCVIVWRKKQEISFSFHFIVILWNYTVYLTFSIKMIFEENELGSFFFFPFLSF